MATVTETRLTPAGHRILDVAATLFYERGINTVGMDLIAATAKVTKKTVYDQFGSKQALVTAYLRHRDRYWRAWLAKRLAAVTDPRKRILATFDALAAWMGHLYRGCSMVNAHAELSDPKHPARELAREQKRRLCDLYAALLAEAAIADDGLATQLTILHEGAITMAVVGGIDDAVTAAKTAAAALLTAAETA